MEIPSQSPQTGQFNSYKNDGGERGRMKHKGLNPLKRVNSILTASDLISLAESMKSLNPLKRVNSILTTVQ